jgi:PAS domain S-box-containing protein
MKRNYLKILLPPVLTILLFILTIFYIIIPRYQETIMNGKREMIKELTNSAWSILSKYENDEREGAYSREEAQETARSRIQYLRYGEENKDYFWITDMRPFMVMHPFREDLNGKDLNDFRDPHGKRLFVEFVETVKKTDHGYVDYMWQWKDDSLHIVPKLSYVRLFEPWGWVIGTGIYIEDVQKEINALTRRLLWISIGITLLIALLLIYISNQSISIERKRLFAESELQESRERYKALVEAATEGLIMLSDGRISFSNNVISKITGFGYSELLNQSFSGIVSPKNNRDIIAAFSQGIVKEGQFELSIIKKNGGSTDVAVTSSVALFYGKQVNILIVKDISIDRFQGYSNIDYHKLISTLNLGFFKARIDNSGKFIYANETALNIFGFDNFRALSEVNFLRFLTDSNDLKNLRKSLVNDGFVKNKVIKITGKNNRLTVVSLSMVVLNEDSGDHVLCDGIIEDITGKETEREYQTTLISWLKSDRMLLDRPAEEFCIPAYQVDADSTIGHAAEKMEQYHTDILLVKKGEEAVIGVVTGSDIRRRVMPLNLNAENPLYLIMSAPVEYIRPGMSAGEALSLCEKKKTGHLVVKSTKGLPERIFSVKEVYRELTGSADFLRTMASEAGSRKELQNAYHMMREMVRSLIRNDASPLHITRINSSFSDAATSRIIKMAIEETGPPPVPFAFICMGSEGRMEESLLTDQDNAIIYEDPEPGREEEAETYFMKLGEKICDALHFTGYSYCRGNIMAKNPVWNQPLKKWIQYFAGWITTPEPQNLLDAMIFFDFRTVYGEEKFAEELRRNIQILIEKQNVFLYHLALSTYNTKVQQISPGDSTDLKACLSHIVMFARTYALQHNIVETSTTARLNALKTNAAMAEATIDEIIYVYSFLMKLRLKNQVQQADAHFMVSNILYTKGMGDVEFSHLKKVLSQIPAYQNKLALDFRLKNAH